MMSYFIEASTCEPWSTFTRRTDHLRYEPTNHLKSGKKTKRSYIKMSRYTTATRVRLGCGGKREGWEGGRISSDTFIESSS